MIARIIDARGTVATLGDDLRWTADDHDLAATLDLLLATCSRSPAMGDWARAHVLATAAALGGTAEFARPIDDTPGRVY
jgi:hypothetical protein